MAAAKKEATAKKKPAKAPKVKATADTSLASKTVRFQDHVIKTKRSGRFHVIGKNGKTVNGADKTKILVGAKLVKESVAKPKEEAAPTT